MASRHFLKKQLRRAQERFEAERDRRYTEVLREREKALSVKQDADRDALILARDIQSYRDEQANNLRTQIESERGSYVTRLDLGAASDKLHAELTAEIAELKAIVKPLADYVASQQGRSGGLNAGWLYLVAAIAALGTMINSLVGILVLLRR